MGLSCLKSGSQQGWFLPEAPEEVCSLTLPTSRACWATCPISPSVLTSPPLTSCICLCLSLRRTPVITLSRFCYPRMISSSVICHKITYLQVPRIQMLTSLGRVFSLPRLDVFLYWFLFSGFRQFWNVIMFQLSKSLN